MVRPAFTKAVLDAADRHGAAVTPDGEAIPGIGLAPASPYLSVTFVKGAAPGAGGRDLIRQAWRGGGLDVRDLIALPAPEDPTGTHAV